MGVGEQTDGRVWIECKISIRGGMERIEEAKLGALFAEGYAGRISVATSAALDKGSNL